MSRLVCTEKYLQNFPVCKDLKAEIQTCENGDSVRRRFHRTDLLLQLDLDLLDASLQVGVSLVLLLELLLNSLKEVLGVCRLENMKEEGI